MTLGKIKVKNFQSIGSGEVELGSFTVFTGPSSSGKSAFLRAAEAVVRNSFNPSQVRLGSKVAEVTALVDDHEITAVRGRSQSSYTIDGEEFTKTGRDVPEKASDIFSMPQIADVETNFSTQFDKPFLIADPGSVGSKVLGSLTNVSVLLASLREASRRAQEANTRVKVKEADQESLRDSLEDLTKGRNIPEVIKQVVSLQDDLARIGEAHTSCTDLDSRISKFNKIRGSLKLAMEECSKLAFVETLDTTINTSSIQTLSRLIKQAHSIEADMGRYTSLTGVTLDADLPDITSLSRLSTNLDMARRLAQEVRKLMEESASLEDQISETHQQYDSIISGLEVCPLCNSTIGESIE